MFFYKLKNIQNNSLYIIAIQNFNIKEEVKMFFSHKRSTSDFLISFIFTLLTYDSMFFRKSAHTRMSEGSTKTIPLLKNIIFLPIG